MHTIKPETIIRISVTTISSSHVKEGRPQRLMVVYRYYAERAGQPVCILSLTRHVRWNGSAYTGFNNIPKPGTIIGTIFEVPPRKEHPAGTETIYLKPLRAQQAA